MPLYLVSVNSSGLLPHTPDDVLHKYKKGIEGLLAKGSLKGAYAKVGGGLVFVINSPGNPQLALELRKHSITNAEVVPLVPLTAVLDAHIEFRKTGKAAV